VRYTTSFVCANLIFLIEFIKFLSTTKYPSLLLQATLWMARAEKLKELMAQREALTAEQVQTPEDLSKFFFFISFQNIKQKKKQTFAFEF